MTNNYPALEKQNEVLADMLARGQRSADGYHTSVGLTVKQVSWLLSWTHNVEVEPTYQNGFRKNVAEPSFETGAGVEHFTWGYFDWDVKDAEGRTGRVTLHRYPNHAGVLAHFATTAKVHDELVAEVAELEENLQASREILDMSRERGDPETVIGYREEAVQTWTERLEEARRGLGATEEAIANEA